MSTPELEPGKVRAVNETEDGFELKTPDCSISEINVRVEKLEKWLGDNRKTQLIKIDGDIERIHEVDQQVSIQKEAILQNKADMESRMDNLEAKLDVIVALLKTEV